MLKKFIGLSIVTSSLLIASDLDALKAMLEKQQQIINNLQEKIEVLEHKEAHKGHKTETIAEHAPHKAESKHSSMMPDISLIGDMSIVGRSISNDLKENLEMPGLTHSHAEEEEHGHTHPVMNEKKGFNLNYAELGMSANVDPFVQLNAVFHLTEDDFEIEELYASSRNLPVQLKAGKFFSDFGRLNAKHHHEWTFTDQPLVYSAFFGSHNLLEKGVQFQYTLPSDAYTMIGLEILRGENEKSFGTDAISGMGASVEELDQPNLTVAYIKHSGTVDNLTFLGGVSYAKGETHINHGFKDGLAAGAEEHAFAGDSKILGLDATFRYDIDANRYVMFENEYLDRTLDGTKYGVSATTATLVTPSLKKEQAGYYSQLSYYWDKTYGIGARYERITQNDIFANGTNQNQPDDLKKYSLMAEYRLSEFAKFRVQYNNDKAHYQEDDAKDFHSLIFQMNFAIGAHGAHSF
jgi:hypothetical protein